ncbi:MAG: fibronectin type III domain-containing protein [Flavobacteriaceae bacterium]|nr:fibronectin type III domain-containing protein [Bacteroidia bacterium]MBT8270118.1 fibronectin type III domain-containing protein [Bacteroidia bacterium]MBT8287304.1 fibronectin type III domain-containing protein [Bacteroidia bacterium]NNF74215.1 fibronectin type III domain-containing protein [Flavobacteriaceae bacterium]NNK88012.1 fibronectin type III domain-containing protein [Flavobacteriaceae bacterium]
MKRDINSLLAIMALLIFAACSGGDDEPTSVAPPPPPPNSAPTRVSQLIFPSSDLLCIDNTITFEWSASTDADGDPITYKLVVATDRDLTNVVEQRTASSTSLTIVLNQGVAYYWRVTAMDNQGGEAEPSNTFAFYTEGDGISNHAPFTAALNAPLDEGSVSAGTVNLSWTGGDSDPGDVLTFDVYFGETEDPALLQADLSNENVDVSATAGMTYYWRVDTIDDSGIKTIGQVWTFDAN